MDEMKKARHDLRQHLAVVQSYLKRDDKTGLAEYIDTYKSRLPSDITEYFCSDDVVNAVISYYASMARDSGIEFLTKVAYPKNCPVSSTDITVLLGNLLENAVEACRREMDDRMVIKLRIKQRGNSTLLILADNTCRIPVIFKNDWPLSSKRDGPGIGTSSIREIAARYDGVVKFEQHDGMFFASVLLKLAPD